MTHTKSVSQKLSKRAKTPQTQSEHGNFAIYYLPQSNTSSLNVMEGK